MLVQWNDFGTRHWKDDLASLRGLRRQMERLFSDFEHETTAATLGAGGQRHNAWPPVTLKDEGDALLLRAEVPGLGESDLDVTLEQSSLTLRGARKLATPEGYAVHRRERGSIQFARSFSLPCRIDPSQVVARLRDGILELKLPKAAESQPRKIQVKAS